MSELSSRPQPLAYTLAGAAEATGYSLSIIKQVVDKGDLTRRYANRKPIILATELSAWLESLPYAPPT